MCNNVYIHTMLKSLFILAFSLVTLELSAQLGTTPILGAKSLSMGNTGAAAEGIQSIYFGSAGLGTIEKYALQISAEQRFTLSDLSLVSAAVGVRTGRFGVLGLFLSNYGLDEYKEQKLGLSYATKIASSISIGAQWSWNTIRIEEYGSTGFMGIDLGIITYLSEQVSVGFHIANPVKINVVENENTARLLNLGLKYQISEKVYLLSDIRHISDIGSSLHVGLDYRVIDVLNLRAGMDTGASSFHFGVAVNLSEHGNVEAGFSNHQYLGATPGISLGYEK